VAVGFACARPRAATPIVALNIVRPPPNLGRRLRPFGVASSLLVWCRLVLAPRLDCEAQSALCRSGLSVCVLLLHLL
jgi:hypothetical protein